MTQVFSSMRQFCVSVDDDLAGFVMAETERTTCVSAPDYIVSVLVEQRRRRRDELLKQKQLVNQLGDRRAGDMI